MIKFLLLLLNILIICWAVPKNQWSKHFVHPKDRSTGINEAEASPHQFPYLVGIFVYNPTYDDFCGGSLISPNYVLTAAHCVDEAIQVTCVFGAHNITTTEDSQERQNSSNFIIHKGWDNVTLNKDDIALIKLSSAVSETSAIQIIPLAAGSNKYENDIGIVAGWGKTRKSDIGINPILRYISPSILSNNDCKKVNNDYNSVITDSLLCISGNAAACLGDSGDPLVVDGKQVGIVSFGFDDCDASKPSVFTRVTEYQDWITKNSDVSF